MNRRELERRLHRMMKMALQLADLDDADREWVASKEASLREQHGHAKALVHSILHATQEDRP